MDNEMETGMTKRGPLGGCMGLLAYGYRGYMGIYGAI